jgi:hypothetical protein
MKGKSKMQRVCLWYWPPIRIGMALIMFFALFCAGGMNTATAAPGKQPGKAPAEAAPAGKAPEKPAEKPAETASKPPIVDPRADRLLREMGDYLKSAQQFSFQAAITFDDVLPSGQKIQFGATQDVAVRRPGSAYVEYRGDVGSRRFWYNGETITLFDPGHNFYAAEKAPPKLDEAMNHLMKEFGFSPPLSDLLYSDPYQVLRGRVQFGIYVGLSEVDGTRCHHLAFVEKYIDWQIWIEDGKELVPLKVLITYKTLPGAPQFTAVLSDWDFTTRLPDALFAAAVPADAQKIQFLSLAKTMEKKK